LVGLGIYGFLPDHREKSGLDLVSGGAVG
jgi:hypothetical protein